ncbi:MULTISPECIES: type II toxin-antitoxin system VapC family toxin [unclassified Caballeronia]|uniref:type II toxin-antitoxin system VapC family toxin n=1 Tax=unclassified Caballeronia TaxID=2646786 RepID=UPI001FD2503D|nr:MULTISPECIES: type II toxin-antitoxin system VapC family toxin [unclassified Caballeronia]MDR5801317.1 type II toxin-antitoxin system VapC family toxin [Caballeronia sp. LZ001]
MRVLLDTHIYIWTVLNDRRLPEKFRRMIADATEVFVSTASIWEMSIKAALGKLGPREEATIDALEEQRIIPLPVLLAHARAVRDMPHLHGDPFDRVIVAQARCELLELLTVDAELAAYSANAFEI